MPATIAAIGPALSVAASAASVFSAVSGSKKSGAAVAAPPPIPEPTALPIPDATGNAKKASIAEQLRRRGRASTILSDTGQDKLGAG